MSSQKSTIDINRSARSSNEALALALQAHKSVSADYLQRARHAEQLVNKLMQDKVDQREVLGIIMQHIQERNDDRSVHYYAILESTVLAVHKCLLSNDIEEIKEDLKLIHKSLIMTVKTGSKAAGVTPNPDVVQPTNNSAPE